MDSQFGSWKRLLCNGGRRRWCRWSLHDAGDENGGNGGSGGGGAESAGGPIELVGGDGQAQSQVV